MSAFKPKRVSGADLAAQLAGVTANLPSPLPTPAAPRPGRPPPTVQINFKATEAFADLLAREGEKAGSTRRFLARILRDAGYEVPEADLNPPDTRRRRGG
jgi:hypothetical protein